MKKDRFTEEIEKKVDIDFDFNDVKKDINIEVKPKKTSTPLKVLIPALSASFAIGVAMVIILPQFFMANSAQKGANDATYNNSDQTQVPEGGNTEAEETPYSNLRLDLSDCQTVFEQNLDYISSGIKLIDDGEDKVYSEDELMIDSSNFNKGVIGKYRIRVSLRENPNEYTYYYAEVIEDNVSKIEVTSYKEEYHLNEEIKKEDITIKKINESNNEYALKKGEYEIKYQNDLTSPGEYNIDVYLLANPYFKTTYQIKVVE